MPTFARAVAFGATALALAGCASHSDPSPGMKGAMAMKGGMDAMDKMAVATFTPTQGNQVHGLVMFHEMEGHLMVHVKLSGVKPEGEHGFHVHENGNCASPDGTSAGGHFNPDGKPHGPQAGDHHAGDMPPLKADANGVVDQTFMLMGPTVGPGPTSLVGHAVIVHAQPDDFTTQPTGNAGARIACGVIAAH